MTPVAMARSGDRAATARRAQPAQHATQRRRSHGEVQGLDFASEESKDKPDSSRRLRRRAENRGSDIGSEALKDKPESSRRCIISPTPTPTPRSREGAGVRNPLPPTGRALQRRRSQGEVEGLDFASEESKEKPDSSRRLRRPEIQSRGSDIGSEALKDKPQSNRRPRAEANAQVAEAHAHPPSEREVGGRAISREHGTPPHLRSDGKLPSWASMLGTPDGQSVSALKEISALLSRRNLPERTLLLQRYLKTVSAPLPSPNPNPSP